MSSGGWKYMPEQPRTCAGCGRKVKLPKKDGEAVWFQVFPQHLTWHWGCREKRRRG